MRAALLVLVSGSAAAQSLSVGVYGGVNFARIASDTTVDTEFVPAPVAGADVELELFRPFALRAGVEYLGAGGKVTSTAPGSPTIDYSMSYLAIPINLRYFLGAGAAEAYLFAGTTLGALLAANQRREDTGMENNVKSALNGVQISVDLGGGIGYRVSDHVTMSADLRYSLGLNDVATGDAVLDLSSWHTNSLQVLVGLSYRFGAVVAVPDNSAPAYASR